MKYDWEKKAKLLVQKIMDGGLPESDYRVFGKHGKFEIFAVAVANNETGEAALMQILPLSRDVIGADIAQDILGDAGLQYAKAVEAMRSK